MSPVDHSSITTITIVAGKVTGSDLRRTFSVDMSSERWRAQNGIRKTASVEHLQILHEDDGDDNGGFGSGSGAFDGIWSSIQRKQPDRPWQTGSWSSILSSSEKANAGDKAGLPPPYVHPLVKRSASYLSEKSLEICTESLGSETGSDGLSSFPPSDSEPEDKVDKEQGKEEEELRAPSPRYDYSAAAAGTVKKAAQRCFPPPLPSLSHRGDGSNLHMRSHRQNGRLVLEAVSVPSPNCFRAQRQGGRLLLTFPGNRRSSPPEMDENGPSEEEEEEEEQGQDHESDWEKEEEAKRENPAADEIHKFLCLTRRITPPWPHRLNRVVSGDSAQPTLAQLIPAATTGRSLNQYVYSWRSKPAADVAVVKERNVNRAELWWQGRSPAAAQVEYLVPALRGCNHQQPPRSRKSLLLWEPHCIATS